MTAPAIGIDLGSSYCCVGIYHDGDVEIIANEQGSRKTATYVAFTEFGILVGEDARNQIARNPQNTIFCAKQLIGRSFADVPDLPVFNHLPFIISDNYGKPMLQVEYESGSKMFTPDEILTLFLKKIKEKIESHLGKVSTALSFFTSSTLKFYK